MGQSQMKTGLQEIGERLTGEWLMRSGADGLAIIDAYRSNNVMPSD
jgi:hypothetical protein